MACELSRSAAVCWRIYVKETGVPAGVPAEQARARELGIDAAGGEQGGGLRLGRISKTFRTGLDAAGGELAAGRGRGAEPVACGV
jgi:hypothetical protein